MQKWWDEQHEKFNINGEKKYITGSALQSYLDFYQCSTQYAKAKTVFEIGIGTGRALREMENKDRYATDISEIAKERVKDITNVTDIPIKCIDIAFCNLVAQHVNDETLQEILKYGLASLKPTGILCMQFADAKASNIYSKELMLKGGILRNESQSAELVNQEGKIVFTIPKRYFNGGSVWWYGYHIRRK